MIIKTDDLHGPEIYALLQEHLRNMALHSPPESVHALDIDALRKPAITFWTAWDNAQLVGCGALKLLDAQGAADTSHTAPHAEIKSMRTAAAHLRKGVARALLSHIIDVARQRGYARLSLETGSAPAFKPAHQLYKDFGFVNCGPFSDYVEDPFSIFMTQRL
jgi:putative acetyltransferase